MKKLFSLLALATSLALAMSGCGGAAPVPTAPPAEPAATPVPPTPTSAPAAETPVAPADTPTQPGETPTSPAEEAASPTPEPVAPLEISSSAFQPGAEIPIRHSCEGANLSPPLEWSGVPEGTQSLALLLDDPDSEPPGFVHWVIYNIPPAATGLPEGVPGEATLDDGTLQGTNDFARFVDEGETFPGGALINRVGYDGPCPPNPHRYVFTLYALDTLLDLPAEATEAQVLQAIEGHVLAQAEIIGIYSPQQ
jgi:Raf kinase inhibitor-like YbhB/YbcL family protein